MESSCSGMCQSASKTSRASGNLADSTTKRRESEAWTVRSSHQTTLQNGWTENVAGCENKQWAWPCHRIGG